MTTGEQAFSCLRLVTGKLVLNLFSFMLKHLACDVLLALGWRGEVGAKPFFKIFQVPLTKGTEGLM